MSLKFITAKEAASFVNDGDVIACSGFTPAGAIKAITKAIADKATEEHGLGREFKIGIITGASTGDSLDGALARAKAIKFRTPYQSNKDLRDLINSGGTDYFDTHISLMAQSLRYGFLGEIDFAIIEASDISENGEIVLTTGVGISPTIGRLAKRVLIELNHHHSKSLRGMHDIYEPLDPPYRREIPVYSPSDRAGVETIKIDPSKIIGVVETDLDDEVRGFSEANETTLAIGHNVAKFLASEIRAGRMPKSFLPVQSGVGNIANAVLFALGDDPDIPVFRMYTEVIQDSVIKLMGKGIISLASGCALTLSPNVLNSIYSDMKFFHDKIILRPSEISNSPEVARRIGVIAINTALEADLFGNINSTQILGSKMMNGIGGSGDFARNAYVSIFTCPSTTKDGKISTIVPMVSHVDHNEHSVGALVTEFGVADLRYKSPIEKMHEIINNCVHPDYRDALREYAAMAGSHIHTPHTLRAAFGMHYKFQETGDMHDVKWQELLVH